MINEKSFRGGGKKKKEDTPQQIQPYDATVDPGYLQAQAYLASLQPQIDKANRKMSQDEIMKSMPALQQALLLAQQTQSQAAPGADWSAINNRVMPQQQQAVVPQFAPQYQGGLFNGPNTVDPQSLLTPADKFTYLAGLLGQPQNNAPPNIPGAK